LTLHNVAVEPVTLQGRGAIALWLDAGTVAHFRNLRITPGN
jgi:hypothetical protein